MQIPFRELNPETLRRVIEEYISREGTDYAHQEIDLSTKTRQIQAQLESGRAVLCYDESTETCNIVSTSELMKQNF